MILDELKWVNKLDYVKQKMEKIGFSYFVELNGIQLSEFRKWFKATCTGQYHSKNTYRDWMMPDNAVFLNNKEDYVKAILRWA